MAINSFLVSPEYMDPAVYVDLEGQKEALLFDCGHLFSLRVRDMQKISRVFISHTHTDHFVGFDHLIRLCLDLDRTIHIYGPSLIIEQVVNRLRSYTWNLCAELPLRICIREIGESSITACTIRGRDGFLPGDPKRVEEYSGTIVKEGRYSVQAAILDHQVPCLAFSLQEEHGLRINKERLKALGFPPGPWLNDLKCRVRINFNPEEQMEVNGQKYTLGFLRENLIEEKRGTKLTYVTDTIFNRSIVRKIVELAGGSDEFYCEAAYLTRDKEKARLNYHLTARQAGILAREAGVKRLIIMHFSRRYENKYDSLLREAAKEFPETRRGTLYSPRFGANGLKESGIK